MIWLVPIVVLLITLYCARQAVYAQTHRSYTASKPHITNEPANQSVTNSTTHQRDHSTDNTSETALTDSASNLTQTDSIQTDSTDADTHRTTPSAQAITESHSQSHLAKNDVKPHEAPSLLYANNVATTVDSDDSEDDDWDEVSDIGDITMDVSEMLKELNLRETDSPRLDIDTNEYSQLKTGQPGDVEPEKIVVVADKLRKMLH